MQVFLQKLINFYLDAGINFYKNTFISNFKLFLLKRCCKPKNITQNFSSKQLSKIENQIDKELDIFRIYKDILFLKKAVYIMLSHDQLAALQLMGCSSNFLKLDLNQLSESIKKQDDDLNYYEQQLAISLSDELQCQFSSKFLEKCENNKLNLDKIDLRILQSIQNEFIL
ncbi:AMP-binding enzyme family protein (macronuclear) [Tetrahymena thermophila SB210]|uniref:AMP-binding enzyme family protein n=1 Tax=Tetrahymena thermophila (strain SB210) TaxID=312017 RepID=W7X6R2_TETTS|nr:AMP-binding enzyme family protein [Tetrahymena thermophila SB210]EWS73067.1 AMP-binding enzyme family protein [Tetrahymena thermophila SB210]|eukprot:XP_012654376.1 AMP-binding enzyme family protein [Tetrahymena thermophila SB210]